MKSRLASCSALTSSLIAFSISAGFWSASAAAQVVGPEVSPAEVAEEPAAAEEAEIVVTAQKREQNLSDVPMSVNALSGDALASRGVQNVQDLAKFTPGLSFVESGASTPVYSLRGVGFFDTALAGRPTVSVYVDQVPLPFSAMSVGAALDLERVEVLKGPQGTLFGQNATGGAINYIAAKPSAQLRSGFNLSYARFNTVDLSGFVTGPVASNLRLRLAARVLRGDEWQKSYTRDDKIGEKKFVQARFIADWEPTETIKFQLNVNGFKDDSDTQAAQFLAFVPLQPGLAPRVPLLIGYPVAPRNNRAADWDANRDFRRDNDFYQVSLRGDAELSDALTVTSLSAYQQLRIDQLTDQDGTALTNTQTTQNGQIKSFTQELRLALDSGGFHGLVGVSYEHDKAKERNIFDFPYGTANSSLGAFGPFPGVRQISDQVFKTYAIFGNVDYDITDQLIVHGGARYTKADFSYDACSADIDGRTLAGITGLFNLFRSRVGKGPLTPLAPNACISFDADFNPGKVTGEFNEDNISWRAGIDFKPRQGALVYANVSRGYKAGSLPVVAAVFADQLRPIKQESILAYEIGTKLSLVDRVLDVTAAAFFYDYSDKQLKGRILTNPNLFGPQEALTNVPRSRIKGVEVQLNLRPVRGLSLSLGGTYIDSEVTSSFSNFTILGTRTDFKGQSFPYTPRYQLIADGEYRWSISPSLQALVGANMNYRSKTKAGFGTESILDIDEYTLIDARVGIEEANRRWSLSLFARNLTDEYYWTNVAKIGDVARRLTGEPRMYGVQASARF